METSCSLPQRRATLKAPADRWQSYVSGRVTVHEVDCQHIQMTQPVPLATIGRVLASEFEKQSPALQTSKERPVG